jgi:hypothetical protein
MLKGHQRLRDIRLQNNYIEWGGIDLALALGLSKNRLYIQGAQELEESMKTNGTLISLDITDCYIGKGIRVFMHMISGNAEPPSSMSQADA